MRPTSPCDGSRIEIVEVGGRGGVHQHTVALAGLLAAHGFATPVLHTATDHEELADGVVACTCFTWLRHRRRLRPLGIGLSFLFRTLPHLARRGRGCAVWVQGMFKPSLTLLLLAVLRLRGCATILSPHNLFSRTGSPAEEWLIRQCVRVARHVVVYNAVDRDRLRSRNRAVWQLPLVQCAPPVPRSTLDAWRSRLPPGGEVVSAIGQIRADKNLPLLIEGAARAGVGVVVVGPDTGGLAEARRRADELGVDVRFHPGYHPLEDLGAVLALTGVVVCPYAVASQSGVARLARSYGAVVVATGVGGLGEQADVVIEELTPDAVARAVLAGLHRHKSEPPRPTALVSAAEDDALLAFLTALGRAAPTGTAVGADALPRTP